MDIYEESEVPGRKLRELKRINDREQAKSARVAAWCALKNLMKQAEELGADAIVSCTSTQRPVYSGNECVISGIAVKFID